MERCSGCRMDHETVLCLFQSDLKNGFIDSDELKKCPCRTCIVKPTCTYDHCYDYQFFYSKLVLNYQTHKLKHLPQPCKPRGVSDCMARIIKISW